MVRVRPPAKAWVSRFFPLAQGTMAALVGGTASRLSGGKFANGAATAAMAYAFNQLQGTLSDGSSGGSPFIGRAESPRDLTDDLIRLRKGLLVDQLQEEIDYLYEIRNNEQAANACFTGPKGDPIWVPLLADRQRALFTLARSRLRLSSVRELLEDVQDLATGEVYSRGVKALSGKDPVDTVLPRNVYQVSADALMRRPVISFRQPSDCQVDWR